MITALKRPCFLNKSAIDHLEWLHDDENFIIEIDILAENLFHTLNGTFSLKIPFLKNRKKSHKPSQVKKEIEGAIKFLENLSPQVLMHILKNSAKKDDPDFYCYQVFIDALKSPYAQGEKHSPRLFLIKECLRISKKFNIPRNLEDKGAFLQFIKIVCDVAQADFDPRQVARDAISR